MLKGKDIVVLSDDWSRHPFSCQHIVERLLPYNRVLWVNTIGYRSIKLNLYDAKRVMEKVRGWISFNGGSTSPCKTLEVINPVCLPFGRYSAVRAFNAFSTWSAMKKKMRESGFTRPIVVTTLPSASDFIGSIGGACSIYYCVDDFTLWPGMDGALMRILEEKLLNMVDLVVASSARLAQTRQNGRRGTRLLTHGVDMAHFSSVGKVRPASKIQGLKKPVVAYYGLIDERADLMLIADLARSMRDVNFLIIGPWRVEAGPLSVMPNVHIIGQVPYSELPAYLASASALILPYALTELSESINPLKLKEYLATGLPVVATPLQEVKELSRFLATAAGPSDFRTALYEAVRTGRRNKDELERFLIENSWEAKAEEFSSMIEDISAAEKNLA